MTDRQRGRIVGRARIPGPTGCRRALGGASRDRRLVASAALRLRAAALRRRLRAFCSPRCSPSGSVSLVTVGRASLPFPPFFWPLAAYSGWTLVTVPFSIDPAASLIESREVLLYLSVPVVYRLARGERAWSMTNVVLTAGAVTAAIGIVQYGVLEFDNARAPAERFDGALHDVRRAADARASAPPWRASRSATRDRLWAALMLPALVAALAVTLTRGAWIGAVAAVGLLLVLRDWRLLLLAPVAAARPLRSLRLPPSPTARCRSSIRRTPRTATAWRC